MNALGTAPGPRGGLILGSLRDIRRDPLGFFLESARKYGGLVRFRAAHKPVFLLSEPEHIRRVLQDNMGNYVKGVSYEALATVMGGGLLVAEGDVWRRHRKLMNPAFARSRMIEKAATVGACAERMLEGWRPDAEIDVVPEMMRFAFDVVGRTLMGADIDDQMGAIERAIDGVTRHVYRRMQSPVKLPDLLNLRQRARMRVLHGVVAAVIAKRRAAGESGGDFLGLLMQARDDESGEGMDDRQLRDEVLTFLLAGHETTGAALSWTLWLLAQHADVERRLHEEAREALGGRAPAAEDLPRLALASRVASESLRLYPPAWAFTRTAVSEDAIGGCRVPAGSVVVISTWVNHRLPRFWDEPDRFDPDRFLPERASARPAYAYFPFGGGPHACIGMHLSMMEVVLALAMIARRWRLELAPGQDVRPEPRISLLPRPGVRMVLRARR